MKNLEKLMSEVKLLLFSNYIRVFGIILYKYFPELVDDLGNNVAKIEFEDNKISKILLNKEKILGMNKKNIVYELLRLLFYIIFNYRTRRRENEVLWDIACEIMILRTLSEFNKVVEPFDHTTKDVMLFVSGDYLKSIFNIEVFTAENIYKALCDMFPQKKDLIIKTINDDEIEFELRKKSFKIKRCNIPYIDSSIIDTIKKEIKSIYNVINKGNVNAVAKEIIEKTIEVDIPWYKILEISIKNIMSLDSFASWGNINKRLFEYGLFPGKQYDGRPYSVFISIDNSLSISSEDLRKFFGVLEQCLCYFEKIFFVEHSVNINRKIELDTNITTTLPAELKFTVGRGGTSHKEVFKYLEELTKNNNISVALFLTDLYSNFNECCKKVLDDIPMVVIVNHTYNRTERKLIENKGIKVIEIKESMI